MDFLIKDARPIWQQLSEQLRRRIVTGTYPPGSRFPTVRELAAEAGVNPNTMQRAITQLEDDALVITNRTAGRTVSSDTAVLEAARRSMAEERVEEFYRDMESLGYARREAAELLGSKGEHYE